MTKTNFSILGLMMSGLLAFVRLLKGKPNSTPAVNGSINPLFAGLRPNEL
jgi:hypothetical protein